MQCLKWLVAEERKSQTSHTENLEFSYWILYYVFIDLDILVHTIFAIKYWVCSKKIQSVTMQLTIDDSVLENQARMLFAIQLLIVSAVTIAHCCEMYIYIYDTEQAFTHTGKIILELAFVVPALVVCIVIIDSLVRIKLCQQKAGMRPVNGLQISFQVISNVLFFTTQSLKVFKLSLPTYYAELMTNWLSFLCLIITCVLIAKLQLNF